MHLSFSHVFEIDADGYWNKLFFDVEYNRRLYLEVLKFRTFEQLELKDEPGGARTRRIRIEPGIDAPAPLRKIIGERLAYEEIGRFDPERRRWNYKVVPSVMPEKVSITGELWVEPRGERRCERRAEVDIKVSIFGVGSLFESVIEKQTRASFEQVPAYTNAFVRERGW